MGEKKFPVKYTVVGINEGESLVAYIAIKCFVTGIVTRFNEAGNASTFYEVVLPFKNQSSERIIPEFDNKGVCSNSENVDMLFDSYNEAVIIANAKNEVMEERILTDAKKNGNDEEAVSCIRSEIVEKLRCAREFQDYIEVNTLDLIIYKEAIGHSMSLKRIFTEGE